MTDPQTSELGKAIQEVSEKASLLVREEIALAKAELTEKATGLAKGAAVGAAAGVFILAGLIYFLHFIALLIADILGTNPWVGYLILSGALFLLGGLAGFLAARYFKKGSPPTPQMAIEEAQLIKQTLTAPHPPPPARTAAPPPPPPRRGRGRAPRSPPPRRRRSSRDDRPSFPGGDPGLDRGQPRRARGRGRDAARRGHQGRGL